MADDLRTALEDSADGPVPSPDGDTRSRRGLRDRRLVGGAAGLALVALVAVVATVLTRPASSLPIIGDRPEAPSALPAEVALPAGWQRVAVGDAVFGVPEQWPVVDVSGSGPADCATDGIVHRGAGDDALEDCGTFDPEASIFASEDGTDPGVGIVVFTNRLSAWGGVATPLQEEVTVNGLAVRREATRIGGSQDCVGEGDCFSNSYGVDQVEVPRLDAIIHIVSAGRDELVEQIIGTIAPALATSVGLEDGEVFRPGNMGSAFVGPLSADGEYGPTLTGRDGQKITAPGEFAQTRWLFAEDAACREVDRETFLTVATDGRTVTFVVPEGREAILVLESQPVQLQGEWLAHDGCENGDPVTGDHSEPATSAGTPSDTVPPGGGAEDPAGALAAARQAWADAGIDDYVFTVDVQCSCPRTGPHRIVVEDGVVVAATEPSARRALSLSEQDRSDLTTVEDLHERITSFVGGGGCPDAPDSVDVVEVRYDELGVPRSARLDLACSIDEEQKITVSGFVRGATYDQRVSVPVVDAIVRPPGNVIGLTADTCNTDEDVMVTETDTEVRLRVTASEESLDDCADGVTVNLIQPLGDRVLVDATTGTAIPMQQ